MPCTAAGTSQLAETGRPHVQHAHPGAAVCHGSLHAMHRSVLLCTHGHQALVYWRQWHCTQCTFLLSLCNGTVCNVCSWCPLCNGTVYNCMLLWSPCTGTVYNLCSCCHYAMALYTNVRSCRHYALALCTMYALTATMHWHRIQCTLLLSLCNGTVYNARFCCHYA